MADLGFTQPTTVQEKVIPIAMGEQEGAAQTARFVDLMVSSQTGSGKTAAFLLPGLHTLLKRQAEAEAEAKAEFQRLAAEAAARGEAVPKKPKRKDPTNARHFKPATPGALSHHRPHHEGYTTPPAPQPPVENLVTELPPAATEPSVADEPAAQNRAQTAPADEPSEPANGL